VSEIFREIDEELRRDNLLKLWKLYGRYIIAGILAVMAIVAGFVVWRDHQAEERLAASARYYGALSLIVADKDADAARIFADLARNGGGYAVLSQFEEAELRIKSGDRAGAMAIYDALAKSGDVDPEFQQLASLLSVVEGMPNSPPKTVIDRLAPLTESGNPWRPTALELTAAADLKAGDKSAALAIYKKLADDLSAPEGQRARAAEMTAALSP
jgi:hypothetical protein